MNTDFTKSFLDEEKLLYENYLTNLKKSILNTFNDKILYRYSVEEWDKNLNLYNVNFEFSIINNFFQENTNKTVHVKVFSFGIDLIKNKENKWNLYVNKNKTTCSIDFNELHWSLDSGSELEDFKDYIRTTKKTLNLNDYKKIETISSDLFFSVENKFNLSKRIDEKEIIIISEDDFVKLKEIINKAFKEEINTKRGNGLFHLFLNNSINSVDKIKKNKI